MAPGIGLQRRSSAKQRVPSGLQRGLFASYFLVFSALLLAFTVAIHVSFNSALDSQVSARLDTLLSAGARSVRVIEDHFIVRQEFSQTALLGAGQALQWYDASGKLIASEGLPFAIHGHTLRTRMAPIIGRKSAKPLGWIRAAQDVTQTSADAWRLDEILIIGGIFALGASVFGGRFLQVRSTQPINDSYERLQEFSANASHELRGPITAVRANADAALRDTAGMRAADRDRFSVISQAAQQMGRLTEDLLLLARAEEPMEEALFYVDLSALVADAVNLYRAEFERHGITLHMQMTPGIMIYGNPDQLQRIFANLLRNAMTYTPAGGTVEIEGVQQRGGVTVHVRDTGIGISREHIDKLFDRFWRSEAARNRSAGTGLGLPIVRALARRHGGDVTVSSAVGEGSDFAVSLPSHPPH
jgi:signal transduction histidine kinase